MSLHLCQPSSQVIKRHPAIQKHNQFTRELSIRRSMTASPIRRLPCARGPQFFADLLPGRILQIERMSPPAPDPSGQGRGGVTETLA